MGSENEIQRYAITTWQADYDGRKDWIESPDPEGHFVFYSDHVAVRKADQERIAAAKKLAETVEAFQTESWRDELASDMAAALAAFRASLSTGEREQETGEAGLIAPGVTKNDGVNTTEGEDENDVN